MPRINTNMQSMVATAAMRKNDRSMAKTLERLSTGLAINRSADNPAGLSVAEQLKSHGTGLESGNRNIQDGISVLNIADGALDQIGNMLHRVRELTLQSSTGTYSDSEREYMQIEVNELCDEIDRIAKSTDYNNNMLLDDGVNSNIDMDTLYYKIDPTVDKTAPTYVTGDEFMTDAVSGRRIILEEKTRQKNNPWNSEEGAFIHIGPNNNMQNDMLNIKINPATCASLGLRGERDIPYSEEIFDEDPTSPTFGNKIDEEIKIRPREQILDVTTQENAQDSIKIIDSAINNILKSRAEIGAKTNRLEHALTTQQNTAANVSEAESIIRDADFAAESTEFARLQVLQQTTTSMLSQANVLPQSVLSLLNNI